MTFLTIFTLNSWHTLQETRGAHFGAQKVATTLLFYSPANCLYGIMIIARRKGVGVSLELNSGDAY